MSLFQSILKDHNTEWHQNYIFLYNQTKISLVWSKFPPDWTEIWHPPDWTEIWQSTGSLHACRRACGFNSSPDSAAYMFQWTQLDSWEQIQSMKFIFWITSPHPDAFYKPNVKIIETLAALSEYYQHLAGGRVWMSWTEISVKFEFEFYHFHSRECIWNCHLQKWRPSCLGLNVLQRSIKVLDLTSWQCTQQEVANDDPFHSHIFLPLRLNAKTATKTRTKEENIIWVRSRRCGCHFTWFCYQMIAKPGNKTAAVSWPDPYENYTKSFLTCWNIKQKIYWWFSARLQ